MKLQINTASITLVTLLIGAVRLHAQCSDNTTTFYAQSSATRLDGNTVKLYNQTTGWGDYYNFWNFYTSSEFSFNGTQESSQPWGTPGQLGVTSWESYSPTLQTYGPGQYYTSASHGAYTPYCGVWATWPPNGSTTAYTNAAIQISRPTRPDYYPGSNTNLYYLGGQLYDGNYAAGTVLAPGNPNGAPESPSWVIFGANELSLSCTSCTNPNATAIAASAGCQSYDFEVHTSYNGFLSDPFYIFINRPWSTVAATDKVGGTWVYSVAYGDGYDTHINYKTLSLCSTDAPMSIYDVNEQFTSSWSLTNSAYNWLAASARGIGVPADGQWWDDINFYSSGSNCSTLPCNPAPSNPGVGPHNLVQYASQSWFVGSQTPGEGARIQTDVLQRYTDSAWHDQITTPAP